MSTRSPAVVFLAATLSEADQVLAVLNEAAAWLRERGVEQWPARFSREWIEPAIARGETWLVLQDGRVGGTVTIDSADPVWSDHDGTAVYVHRMAVRRHASGLGARIIDWATEMAVTHGRDAVRLDCVASNDRLRAYYEARGFLRRGEVPVGGAPGQRLDTGPLTMVCRYELVLPAGRRGSVPSGADPADRHTETG